MIFFLSNARALSFLENSCHRSDPSVLLREQPSWHPTLKYLMVDRGSKLGFYMARLPSVPGQVGGPYAGLLFRGNSENDEILNPGPVD